MQWSDVLSDTKNPEKETIELKQSFSDMGAIGRTIAGFATKKGGKIYVGFNKDGSPCGTSCSNEITGKLQTIANQQVDPPIAITIEKLTHDSKKELFVVCINVKKGKGVHSFNKVPYERRDDTNHPLSSEEVFEIQKDAKKIYFDEMESISVSENRPAFITDISEEKIANYISLSKENIPQSIDVKRFLINNMLTIDSSTKINNGGILLFGSQPQKFIPQAKITLLFFPSKDVTENFSRKEISGDLFDMLEHAFFEIRKNMNVHSFVIEGGLKRIDILDYPTNVIREALVNAIVHRDYFDRSTEIIVKMFSDRIEIINSVVFPFENVSFEEIRKSGLSKRRNPTIADIFQKAKIMEKGGRGLSGMEVAMSQHGLPLPIFEVGSRYFKITLRNASDNPKILMKSPFINVIDFSGLNERQKTFIGAVGTGKPVTRGEYMQLLKINEKMATRDLDDLVRRHMLVRMGEKRGTRYFLVNVP